MVVMEDERDDVVMLQLYQQEDEDDRPARDIVGEIGVCIVKEPYFKVMADGEYGMRIDHVSDLIWLSETDERVPMQWRPRISQLDKTADEWRCDGNAAMKAEKFFDAIKKQVSMLRHHINRSLANLKLRYYDAALVDANCTPANAKLPEKGLYRAARALYELGRFQECSNFLELLLKGYPGNEPGKRELSRVNDRLREQKHGQYNFKAMYEATKVSPLYLDHATYVGPVEIKESEGRGRGLFTTRAVKAGELLLCEKAFAHCYADSTEGLQSPSSKISLLMNTHTNRMVIGTLGDLIQKVVQQLLRNPSLAPAFTSLYHGSYEPVELTHVDEAPVVDTFLIDRVISLNAFGCPLSSLKSHFAEPSPNAEQRQRHYHSCGLWVQASYINHSCYKNVKRSFIGDMQIIRATGDLPAGSEMTFWYYGPNDNGYSKRQEGLQQTWGFQCKCVICIEEKNTPKKSIKKREVLLGDLKAACEASGGLQLSKAERLLTAIEQTYKTNPAGVPRLALWDRYLMLTRIYAAQNQPEKVIATTLKVLGSLGFVIKGASLSEATNSRNTTFEVEQWGLMLGSVIEAWVHLWTAYAYVAPELCGKAEECARIAYRVCIGEDTTFDENYGKKALIF
ncbi:MAG: hypothetical protein M1830_000932 [Pleopsidium flavum]|nr:MAG: hypothetical protein M1830_000932 [Pleopsidium flavum]